MGGEGPVARRRASAVGRAGAEPAGCDERSTRCSRRSRQGKLLGMLAAAHGAGGQGPVQRGPTGRSAASQPPDVQLAEVRSARCFQTDRYSVGDRGLHAVTERPREGDTISLPRYLAPWRRCRAARERGLPRRARRRPSRLLQIPQDARPGDSSLLRRSRPAGRRRALRRSRAPGRRCAAARAAHRYRFASALSAAGTGGARASGRSAAGLHLLHRPPRAGVDLTNRQALTGLRERARRVTAGRLRLRHRPQSRARAT